jgi:hypothetical protein
MLNKSIFTAFLFLSSIVSFAATNVDVTVSCVIEGHGGGCQSETISLNQVPGAVTMTASTSEEDCYEDANCEFCHTTVLSKVETSTVNYLTVNVEEAKNALVLNQGTNEVRVNFYDANGSYITTQFLDINASVEMTY